MRAEWDLRLERLSEFMFFELAVNNLNNSHTL